MKRYFILFFPTLFIGFYSYSQTQGSLLAIPFTDINTVLPGNNFSTNVWGDYDNDGDLDLLIVGASYSKIVRNDSIAFTEINTSLPSLNRSSADWGDFDNDGDLDIALNGFSNGSPITKIYKNSSGTFTDINANIIGLSQGSVDWGDYDNDGDLDLLITGGDSNMNEHTKVYKNTSGTFADSNLSFADVWYSKAKWGDYDNDGDLDIVIIGSEGSSTSSIIKLYKNTGGTFSFVDIGLLGINGGALALGDYDSDGDLDILISGSNYPNYIAKIYKNTNGSFSDINASIIPYYGGSAEWGDYDNDGDLDILMTGDSSKVSSTSVSPTKIYTNVNGLFEDSQIQLQGVNYGDAAWGDYDKDGDLDIILTGSVGSSVITKIYRNDIAVKNTPPSAPTNLSATYSNGTINLSWVKGSDTRTNTSALTSNIYLSNTSQGSEKVSSMSHYNGKRKVVAYGNAYTNSTISINNLSTGVYYWSVQTIDNSFAGSTFSSEKDFAVNMPPTISNINPSQGPIGTDVIISGTNFYGVISVKFNGVSSTYTVSNSGIIVARVPIGATTGTIVITTINNTVASINNFIVTSFTDINAPLPATNFGSSVWGDYDNDGDLDIMIIGASNSKILRNDSGIFTSINSSIPALNRSSAAWGDYDNDGDLDIALNGFNYPTSYTKIYKNTNGVFTDINATMIGLREGSVDWGDYDNDGDLDLLITGEDDNSDPHTKVYKNTSGIFTDINATITNVWDSEAKWGDYDNDGDLDAIIIGYDASYNAIVQIYKNTTGVFSYVDIGLIGVHNGALALGDYDSDGDLDILMSGYNYPGYLAKIYKNTNGSFSDINASLIGYYGGSAKWGDYDNDGDLDILMTGDSSKVANSPVSPTKIYTNVNGQFEDSKIELQGVKYGDASWGDYDMDGDLDIVLIGSVASSVVAKIYRNDITVKNTPPSAPTNLSSTYSNGIAKLSWAKGSDSKTATTSLTSNIYLSTTPWGYETVSSMSDNYNGYRRVVAYGNAYTNNTISLNNLPAGVYYWSVQTVDNSFSGSAFASLDSIVVNIPPTIVSFTPISGVVGGTVTITGTNFTGATSVKFNGVTATYSVVNGTQITATVPTGAITGKLSVTTSSGTATSTNDFTVTIPVPTITSFTPASGAVGSTVTITGTNFNGASSVKFNAVAAGYTVVSSNQITATVPPTVTTGKITVTTSSGIATSTNDFTVTLPVPTITSFTPVSGIVGSSVTITGTNFTGATSVKFNGVAATYTGVNSTQISATVPTSAITGKISVTTASGTAISTNDFTVTLPAPTITSFTPSSGIVGSTVMIAGTNLTGATSVKFNGVTAVYSVVSSNQIAATVPPTATTGKLTVTTLSGTATSTNTFTVTLPAPTITSFTPSSGIVGSTVMIAGTNLTGATSVKFNGVTAVYSVVSSSQITTTVPVTATTGKLTVATSSGTATSTNTFTVTLPAPTITSFTPSSGIVGSTVIIAGTNLTGASSVKFNGVTAVYSVVSSNQIAATVPPTTTTGKLTVTTLSGTATSTNTFTVTLPAPTITSFTPSSGIVGSTVMIAGTNFTGATSVKFNGVTAVYSVVSSNQIAATVPPTATTGKLTVTTLSGTATSTNTFTVTLPAPTITSFTPSSGIVGSTVMIAGTNFTGATSVKFNGVTAVYSVVSSNQIAATVPPTATTGKLTVTTLSGTATSTNTFTVTLPAPTITSFAPSSGAVGSTVTITGTNLTGATSVKFNGVTAVYSVISSSQITATVPSTAITGKVAVTTISGTATSTGNFTIIPPISIPKVQSFNPLQSLPGNSVVISGLNFVSISSVKFNGLEADFKVVNSSYISATVPLNATTGKVIVTNTAGSGTSVNNFIILEKINAPANLTTQSAVNSIILHWNDSSNNESGFVIEKYINNDIKFSVIGKVGTGVTKYTDSVNQNKTEQYRVYAYNSSNKSDYSNVASGNALVVTGIEDQLETGIKVFPNPGKDKFSIEVKNSGRYNFIVTDILGNKVYEERDILADGGPLNLDLSKEREGIYFLKISYKKDSEVIRLFKE